MFRNGLKKKRVKSKCGSTNARSYKPLKAFRYSKQAQQPPTYTCIWDEASCLLSKAYMQHASLMTILPAPIHRLSWVVCYPKLIRIKVNVAVEHIHKSLQRLPFVVSQVVSSHQHTCSHEAINKRIQ